MKQTLLSFTRQPLFDAASAFLGKLGIKHGEYDTKEPLPLTAYFDDSLPQYLQAANATIDKLYDLGRVNDSSLGGTSSVTNSKYVAMNIFAFDAKPQARITRTIVSSLTRAFNRIADDPVILIIRQGNNMTLSTCDREKGARVEIMGKVTILRNIDCTNPHPGHIQILDRIAKEVNGCSDFDTLYKKWLCSFSIKLLSDDFFDGYKAIYEDIIALTTGKRMKKEGNKWVERIDDEISAEEKAVYGAKVMASFGQFEDPEKAVRDYVKKLMGRLVFIQFLQKKGWMGVAADKPWGEGDRDFIQNVFKQSTNKDNFVDEVLEPLFRDINTDRAGYLVTSPKVNFGQQIKVPYLNGGLFEEDAYDRADFAVPAKYFWNEDATLGTKDKDLGLLQFFAKYNFTIDENAPDDVEIGVDPEMLGRIFENLLEDNKDKGVFYTPKEIVHYMCRESLIAYLQNDIEDDVVKQSYRNFVTTHEVAALNPADVYKVDKKLREVKICDPAIGSGAFPMGLLKELFDCRMAIEGDEEGKTPADVKKDIIQNSIYGVDIEKGAVDIARLRFWLSLIIDEQTPQALPNMDFKIMQGNSLLEQYKGVRLDNIYSNSGLMELAFDEETAARMLFLEYIYKYFKEDDHDKKKKLLVLIDNAVKSLVKAKTLGNEEIAESIDSLDLRNNTDFFLWHTWFNDVLADKKDTKGKPIKGSGGFDIVIGNPPYVSTKGSDDAIKKTLKETYGFADDLYSHFIFQSFNLLRCGGVQSMITSDTYFTTVMKANVRKTIMDNSLLQLVHWGYDIFPSAMVSTATFVARKAKPADGHKILVIDMKGRKSFSGAPSYNVPIRKYKESVNGSFFVPKALCDDINNKYGKKHCDLVRTWFDAISTSKKIEKNANKLNVYRDSLKVGDLTLLGLLTDGGQGLATANNGKYVGVRQGTKAAANILASRSNKLAEFNRDKGTHYTLPEEEMGIWSLFDDLKEKYGRDIFGQGYIFRIVPDELIADYENLSEEEKNLGITGSVTFVPYDKGDKDGNRWYLETPYLIDWSKTSVKFLKDNSGKKGNGMPVVRNPKFYFQKGFCYSDIKTFFLRCRLKGISVHDVKSMSLFPMTEKVPDYYIVTLINSHLMASIVYNFLNNTPSFQINDCRVLPIVVPTTDQLCECKTLFDKAVAIQEDFFAGKIDVLQRDNLLLPIQDEIDAFVYRLYGINTTEYLAHINKPYLIE